MIIILDPFLAARPVFAAIPNTKVSHKLLLRKCPLSIGLNYPFTSPGLRIWRDMVEIGTGVSITVVVFIE